MALGAISKVHHLLVKIQIHTFLKDLSVIIHIAMPAVLTNMVTPIGSSYVLKVMSGYGDSAVAGAAIIGRMAPVAFAALFALSGAIGPIIGQNAGAGRYDRVRQVVWNAMLSNAVYVVIIWLCLMFLNDWVVELFSASGEAAELIYFYTDFLAVGFMFSGMLFIANACFNNLNRAYFSMMLSFGRSLLGTIPFVYFLSQWYGAKGVISGEIVGAGLFGVIGFILIFRHITALEKKQQLSLGL